MQLHSIDMDQLPKRELPRTMIYDSYCSVAEVKKSGPLVRSALPHYERKVDMMNNSVSNHFASWGIDNEVSDVAHHFGLQGRDVSPQASKNLSGTQEEVMLWHLKLGISMGHIQRLMKVTEMYEPNGRVSVMDRVIVPKLNTADNCEIPLYASCNLSRAR